MDYGIINNFNEETDCWEIAISGEIDIFNSTALKEQLIQLTKIKAKDLHINCKDLSYIDSTGLGALVAVLRNVKEYNGEIRLLELKYNLEKMFKITNLDNVFIIEGGNNG